MSTPHPLLEQTDWLAKAKQVSAARFDEVIPPSVLKDVSADRISMVEQLRYHYQFTAALARYSSILANRLLEIERLREKCSTDALAEQLDGFLSDPEFCRQLDEIAAMLGEPRRKYLAVTQHRQS